MALIPDASNNSLVKFINDNIELVSRIFTDGGKGHNGISKKGYLHYIEDKAKIADGDEILPNVHRISIIT